MAHREGLSRPLRMAAEQVTCLDDFMLADPE
jgi:hypothetical protein